MNSRLTSRLTKALVVIAVLGVMSANVSVANAATKTITCYKGTAVKKVNAVSSKCPKGWFTKNPKAGTVALNATYKGELELVWSGSEVRGATSVTGAGTGTTAGLDELIGTGSAGFQWKCDAFNMVGTLSGGGSTLKVKFDSNAMDCGLDDNAENAITITGTASITGGTGKFAGATGTLKTTGTFSVASSQDVGSSESGDFTITLSGKIKTK